MTEAQNADLTRELITGRIFKFSRVDGSGIGQLTLAPEGRIEGSSSTNEESWDIDGGDLVFRSDDGTPKTIFNEIDQSQPALTLYGEFLPRGPGRWHVLVEEPILDRLPISGKYDLSHLTQPSHQDVSGPIQDDEALFLFALIRVMRIRRVLEIGGLSGYSATNFIRAVGSDGIVYTIDIYPVPKVAPNHVTITMDARLVTPEVFGKQPLDLIFFDCHEFEAQMEMLSRLSDTGMIVDRTVLAFHDTNLHPTQKTPSSYQVEGGWVHQHVERRMVNELHALGYDAISLDTSPESHGPDLPVRHGLAIMKRFRTLVT
jgi:hypothetical protein